MLLIYDVLTFSFADSGGERPIPRRLWRQGGKIQRGRATLGHLANVGKAGRLFLLNGFKETTRRQVLSKRKRQIDRSMKRAGGVVLQILKNLATQSIRNFGRLLTLIVGMRNVGYDNKGPGNGRGIDFSNADALFLEYAQKDLKPETAVEILKKHGMLVSVDQAKSILEFFQKLADITVTQYLRK